MTDSFIGIHNLGTTCHIESAIQVLFTIKPLVKAISELEIKRSPIKELFDIFSAMQAHIDNHFQSTDVISPMMFISALGRRWFNQQDCDDTFIHIANAISTEFSHGTRNIMNDLFHIKTSWIVNSIDESGKEIAVKQNKNPFTQSAMIRSNDVMESLTAEKSKLVSLSTSQIFVISIQRQADDKKFKPYMKRYQFPVQLDLSEISDGPYKKYDLFAIIAYSEHHFITFQKIDLQWYTIDDENVYEFNHELIPCLFDGEEQNALWECTDSRKWIAKLLFYKEEHFEIN